MNKLNKDESPHPYTLLRPKEAAKLLGCHPSTIQRRQNDPDFPPKVKIGSTTGFRLGQLMDYIDANEVEASHG